MEKYLETIRKNNNEINNIIQEFISKNTEEAFKTTKNGKLTISSKYEQIIQLEIDKILKLYHLEFPDLSYDENRKLNIDIYNGSHLDARYSNNSLKYSYGIKREFEKIHQGKIYGENLGYDINDDGKIIYNQNGTTEKFKCNLVDEGDEIPFILSKEETIENDLNENSEYLYYYLNNCKYEHFLFNVMPHELAHAFGFGGNFFEGLTENISREVSQKYNLSNTPFSRDYLTKIIQKIEKIIGRDELVKNAHQSKESPKERCETISDLLDDVLKVENKGSFKALTDIFSSDGRYCDNLEKELINKMANGELSRTDCFNIVKNDKIMQKNKELINAYYNRLNSNLDEYISNNPKKLFALGDTECVVNKEDFMDFISYQEKEIESLKEILTQLKHNTIDKDFKSQLNSLTEQKNVIGSKLPNYNEEPNPVIHSKSPNYSEEPKI